jgi:hypothetical protein
LAGFDGERKLHLVKWNTVCSPFPRGGLGVKNLMLFDKALLGKWLWTFTQKENSSWRQVLVDKYGIQKGGRCSEETQAPSLEELKFF